MTFKTSAACACLLILTMLIFISSGEGNSPDSSHSTHWIQRSASMAKNKSRPLGARLFLTWRIVLMPGSVLLSSICITLRAEAIRSILPRLRYRSFELCFLFRCPISTMAQSYIPAQIESCRSIFRIPETLEISASPR